MKTPEPQNVNEEMEKMMKEIEEGDKRQGISQSLTFVQITKTFSVSFVFHLTHEYLIECRMDIRNVNIAKPPSRKDHMDHWRTQDQHSLYQINWQIYPTLSFLDIIIVWSSGVFRLDFKLNAFFPCMRHAIVHLIKLGKFWVDFLSPASSLIVINYELFITGNVHPC